MPEIDIHTAANIAADLASRPHHLTRLWRQTPEEISAAFATAAGTVQVFDLNECVQETESKITAELVRVERQAIAEAVIRLGHWGPDPKAFGAGWVAADGNPVQRNWTWTATDRLHPEVDAARKEALRAASAPLNRLEGLARAATWHRTRAESSPVCLAHTGVTGLLRRVSALTATCTRGIAEAGNAVVQVKAVEEPTYMCHRGVFLTGQVAVSSPGNTHDETPIQGADYSTYMILLGVTESSPSGCDGELSVFFSRGQGRDSLEEPVKEIVKHLIFNRALQDPDNPVWG